MSDDTHDTTIDEQAIQWLLRVHASDVSDADIDGLTAWLEASDAHLASYDRAESLWAQEVKAPETEEPTAVIDLQAYRKPSASLRSRRDYRLWAAGAIAASVAGLAAIFVISAQPVTTTYVTAKGQVLQVSLDDGTHLHLNTDTSLSVVMSRSARVLDLKQGEVALDVVHDDLRPFTVQAGDTRLRDVGTKFDVLQHDGTTTVTVGEGAVAVLTTGAGGETLAPQRVLRPGDQVVVDQNGNLAGQTSVIVEDAFAWERGQVVYHDRTLAYIIGDLNRYFRKPIVVDGETGKMRLTAVITLDSEASVVQHLQDFLPIEATTTDRAIILRARH